MQKHIPGSLALLIAQSPGALQFAGFVGQNASRNSVMVSAHLCITVSEISFSLSLKLKDQKRLIIQKNQSIQT